MNAADAVADANRATQAGRTAAPLANPAARAQEP